MLISPAREYQLTLDLGTEEEVRAQAKYPDIAADVFHYTRAHDIAKETREIIEAVLEMDNQKRGGNESMIILEAMAMVSDDYRDIAERTGLSEKVVEFYVKLFYDVNEHSSLILLNHVNGLDGREHYIKRITLKLGVDFACWYFLGHTMDQKVLSGMMRRELSETFFALNSGVEMDGWAIKRMVDIYGAVEQKSQDNADDDIVKMAMAVLKESYGGKEE